MTDDSHKTDFIQETWWHRLFRVFTYAAAAFVVGFVALDWLEAARYRRCVYSFQADYNQFDLVSSAREFLSWMREREQPAPPPPPPPRAYGEFNLYCGGWVRPRDFIDIYTATHKEHERRSKVKAGVEKARKAGYSDEEIAVAILGREPIKYRRATRYNANQLIYGFSLALIAGTLMFVLLNLLHKTILYVVYGHTRVRTK